jgi:cytochrome P450
MNDRARDFPIGSSITIDELDRDPHPALARLRERERVSWLPALDGWLVTGYAEAVQAMRTDDLFTVDDERFSTARVVGPSMLSLDGERHTAHRGPFAGPFRPGAVRGRFAAPVHAHVDRLVSALAPMGRAELRRGLAGPLAASIVAEALGIDPRETDQILAWYDAIVSGVTEITTHGGLPASAERAYAALRDRLERVIGGSDRASLLAAAADGSNLSHAELASNAAVLLFGGIETTEGMIANAVLALLERPDALERVHADPRLLDAAIEESLRLEPAAAVVDRYATTAASLGTARIEAGELVRISIAGANRDPDVFPDPDRFDLARAGRRHVAFAHGPHVCVGVHLARLEARSALAEILARLPNLRLDPARRPEVRGLVFRKPVELHVLWDPLEPRDS